MQAVKDLSQQMKPILNQSLVRQVRRNHALEHATVHMLQRRGVPIRNGISHAAGFYLWADAPTVVIEDAVHEALTRLQKGESGLAIHPDCGTNLLVSATLATGVSALGFAIVPRRNLFDRFINMILVMAFTLLYSKPLGMAVQQNFTTEADPGTLEVVRVTSRKWSNPLSDHAIVVHDIATTF